MITAIGKYLRKLRIQHNEILKDMADHLGVKSAFLSAVENGKKKMPKAWPEKLADIYGLTQEDIEELMLADMESQETIKLNLENVANGKRKLAISFARQFDSLDTDTAEQIFNILNRNREE